MARFQVPLGRWRCLVRFIQFFLYIFYFIALLTGKSWKLTLRRCRGNGERANFNELRMSNSAPLEFVIL